MKSTQNKTKETNDKRLYLVFRVFVVIITLPGKASQPEQANEIGRFSRVKLKYIYVIMS